MDSDRTGGRKVVCDCQNCLKHSSTGARVHRSTAYQHRKNALADELLARAMESRPSKSVKDLRTGNSPFTSTDTPRGMLSAARDVITDAVQAASTLADLELAYRNLSAAEPFQPSDLLFLFLPDLSVSTLEDSIDAEERCLDQQDGRTGAYVSHLLVLRRFCIQVNQVRDRLNETFLNTVAEELSAKASDLLKLHREVLVQASLAESRRRQTVEDMKRDGVEVIHIGGTSYHSVHPLRLAVLILAAFLTSVIGLSHSASNLVLWIVRIIVKLAFQVALASAVLNTLLSTLCE